MCKSRFCKTNHKNNYFVEIYGTNTLLYAKKIYCFNNLKEIYYQVVGTRTIALTSCTPLIKLNFKVYYLIGMLGDEG